MPRISDFVLSHNGGVGGGKPRAGMNGSGKG
jgi:hypothetical protein